MKLESLTCNNYEKTFEIYRMSNENGIEVEIISIGAAITKIMVPDRAGVYKNIVLGYKDYNEYFNNNSKFGAIVGRTAGRIGDGKFKLNGEEYLLPKNNNGNTLHGGSNGLNKKLWKGQLIKEEDSVGVKLTCVSDDGEEGYPGRVEASVYYKLGNDNSLSMIYEAVTDKDTLFNPTNHSYFNLSGDCERDVLKHKMMINADYFCEIDDKSIVTGRLLKTEDTPFDFRTPKEIGKDIGRSDCVQLSRGNGYDHPWILKESGELSASLRDEESGRVMEVTTTAKAIVCYTMNYASDENLSCGKSSKPRMACCFETQAPPIGYNDEFIEESIITPDSGYKMTTVFKFLTE